MNGVKVTVKQTRRGLSKNKLKINQSQENLLINILGINSAGILSKLDSFDHWLKESNPQIFSIQETKVQNTGQVQSKTLDSYQLYELIRDNNPGQGGGLCIGVSKDLPSCLLREGGQEVECLSVQVQVGQQEVVVVNGYGPQMVASQVKKEQFWEYLEREVVEADRDEKMLVIQMDANCWLGANCISGDPNKLANSNGKLFHDFLK